MHENQRPSSVVLRRSTTPSVRHSNLVRERRDRHLRYASIVLVCGLLLTDPLRKLLPQYEGSLLILLYASTAAAYLLLLSSPRLPFRLTSDNFLFVTTISFYAWFIVACLFTWPGSAYIVAIVNSYLFFQPLALLIPRVVPPISDLRVVAPRVAWVSLIVGATGVASAMHVGGILAPIAADAASHSFGNGSVSLASGIFATGERLARTLVFPLLFCVTIYLQRGRRNWLYLASIAMSTAAIIVSGRRFAILLMTGMVALLLLAIPNRSKRTSRLTLISAVGAVSGYLAVEHQKLLAFFISGFSLIQSRAAYAADISISSALGQGPGTTSQGAPAVAALHFIQAEGGLNRLALELGTVGLVLGILWGLGLLALAWRAVRRGVRRGDPVAVAAGLTIISYLAWALKAHVTFGDPYSLLIFWLCVGYARSVAQSPHDTVATPRV